LQVRAGSLSELGKAGQLRTKVGAVPVVVFWHDGRAWAIDDRCPHMGFPLHRGTVEDGLVTCHWHHARFDLASGCTLDLFADDARAFDVTIEDGDVVVASRPDGDRVGHLRARLQDGLADGLTLVTAKSVLGLLAAGVGPPLRRGRSGEHEDQDDAREGGRGRLGSSSRRRRGSPPGVRDRAGYRMVPRTSTRSRRTPLPNGIPTSDRGSGSQRLKGRRAGYTTLDEG